MHQTPDTLTVQAHAKINLFLEVTGRRPDGYHTLLSHMQGITLYDELTLTRRMDASVATTFSLSCSDPSLPCDENNLVCRAARVILDELARRGVDATGHWSAVLTKHIPMAAGLAGGSADAAATLKGINQMTGNTLDLAQLCRIGLTIGADVPFCLCASRGAMTAQGIGEQLSSAPSLPASAHLVVACHGEGVSTPWAYRRLDELGLSTMKGAQHAYDALIEAMEAGDVYRIGRASYNAFERAILPERPAVAMLMSRMQSAGACFVRMSGSGPSVVGVFDDEPTARACQQQLDKSGVQALYCRPLS